MPFNCEIEIILLDASLTDIVVEGDKPFNKPLTANPIFGPLSLLNREQIYPLAIELSTCNVKV